MTQNAEHAIPELSKEVDIRSLFINFSDPIIFQWGFIPFELHLYMYMVLYLIMFKKMICLLFTIIYL